MLKDPQFQILLTRLGTVPYNAQGLWELMEEEEEVFLIPTNNKNKCCLFFFLANVVFVIELAKGWLHKGQVEFDGARLSCEQPVSNSHIRVSVRPPDATYRTFVDIVL